MRELAARSRLEPRPTSPTSTTLITPANSSRCANSPSPPHPPRSARRRERPREPFLGRGQGHSTTTATATRTVSYAPTSERELQRPSNPEARARSRFHPNPPTNPPHSHAPGPRRATSNRIDPQPSTGARQGRTTASPLRKMRTAPRSPRYTGSEEAPIAPRQLTGETESTQNQQSRRLQTAARTTLQPIIRSVEFRARTQREHSTTPVTELSLLDSRRTGRTTIRNNPCTFNGSTRAQAHRTRKEAPARPAPSMSRPCNAPSVVRAPAAALMALSRDRRRLGPRRSTESASCPISHWIHTTYSRIKLGPNNICILHYNRSQRVGTSSSQEVHCSEQTSASRASRPARGVPNTPPTELRVSISDLLGVREEICSPPRVGRAVPHERRHVSWSSPWSLLGSARRSCPRAGYALGWIAGGVSSRMRYAD